MFKPVIVVVVLVVAVGLIAHVGLPIRVIGTKDGVEGTVFAFTQAVVGTLLESSLGGGSWASVIPPEPE
jgi:hypothetical protein